MKINNQFKGTGFLITKIKIEHFLPQTNLRP